MANAASTGDPPPSFGSTLAWDGTDNAWVDSDAEITKRIERIEKINEKIMERLAILEDPSPEQLEQFKALKDLHDKYKFVESLCEGKDDTS